jgi:hypothetical protein
LQVPVYKFLKTPLIRKYEEDFYKTLCEAAEEWERGNLNLTTHKNKKSENFHSRTLHFIKIKFYLKSSADTSLLTIT